MKRNALMNPSARKGFILPAVVLMLILLSVSFITTQAQAASGIQKTINFQGKVVNSDGTNVADGVYDFVVQIYDGAGNAASSLYTESWTAASLFSSTMSSAPTTSSDTLTYSSNTNESSLKVGQILWNTTKGEAIIITSVDTGTNILGISRPIQNWANGDTITNGVYVKDGVFRIAINSLNQNIAGVNFGSDNLFVGVNFNADGEMRPRMQLRANAYAYNAEKVNGLTVTNTSDTAFSTTTTLKINDGSTVTFGGNFDSGSNALTLTTSGATALTLPTSGTVSTLAGAETLTNKTVGSTGLTFSGATTDITTAANEGLTLEANGTGDITLITDAGSDLILSGMTTDANGLLYANTSGVLTRVAETETGSQCLLSGAGTSGVPSWGTCGIDSQWTTSGSNIYYDAGNVGIGNANPTRPFHLYGEAPDSSNGTTAYINSDLTSATNNQIGLFADGNIVLSGVSSETYTGLQGSIYNGQDDDTFLAGASMIGLRGSAYFDGDGTYGEVKGGDYSLTLDSAGTIASAYGLMINSTINNGGTINSLYGLAIAGQTTGVDSVGLAINEATGSDDEVNLLIGTLTVPNADYSIFNSSTEQNYFAGNLGIGTTTPSTFALELAGSIGPSANDTYDLGSDARRFRDLYLGPDTLHIGTSTSDEYAIGYNTTSNYLGFNANGSGNPEVIFESTGNVGIGTTTPNLAKLHVGDSASTTSTVVRINNAGASSVPQLVSYAGSGTREWVSGGTGGNGLFIIGLNPVGYSQANALSSAKLAIDGNGNVGIGTTAPSTFKLELAGSIGPSVNDTYDLGSDTRRFQDLYLGPDTLHIGTSTSDEYTIGYDTTNNRLGFNVNGSGNSEIVFDSNGNVGIGTTAPSEKMDIDGNIELTGSIKATTAPTETSISRTSTTVDSTGSVGAYTAITLGADTFPVISYYESAIFDLKVLKCGNAACSSGNTTTTIDSTGSVGSDSSITLGADNFPVISYYDTTNTSLKVIKCGNAACSSGNTTTTVDNTASVGQYTSITLGADNFPVISYYDTTNTSLKVIKCGNAACSSGNTTTTVDNTASVGQYTSITLGADNFPVISYYDGTTFDLKVLKCGNAACSSGNTTTTIDSTGSVGFYTAITLSADTFPVISYYDGTNFDLKVVKCGNAACSSGNTTTTIDSTGDVGDFTSIVLGADSFPIISYHDSTNEDLKVVKCGNAACSSGNAVTMVDNTASVGQYTSITLGADNNPVISHTNVTSVDLRVTRCVNVSCSATSATIASGGQDIGTDAIRFNNIYGTTLWGTNMNLKGDIQLNGVVRGSDIGARVSRTSNQAVGINSSTTVTFNTEVYDTDNIHDNSTNSSRLTANTAGKYVISGNVKWTLGTNGDGGLWIVKNGSALVGESRVVTYYLTMNVSTVIDLDVGDYVELVAYYNGAAARSIDASTQPNSPSFSMQRISGADLAEYYPVSDTSISEGDIVSIDPETLGAVKKASSAYEKNIGIISANPAVIMGNTPDKVGNKPVGLKGKVPVKVTSRNGLIKNGDPITASTLPGIGMRAGQSGHLAAVALDDFDPSKMQCQDVESIDSIPWPNEGENMVITGHGLCYRLPDGEYIGEILASIDNSFYEPYTITDAGNIKITKIVSDDTSYAMSLGDDWENTPESRAATISTDAGYDVKVGDETIKRQGLFSELISGTIKAGEIDASRIIVGGVDLMDLLGLRASDSGVLRPVPSGTLVTQNGQEITASFSGKLATFTSVNTEGLSVRNFNVTGTADIADLQVGALSLTLGVTGGKLSVKGSNGHDVLTVDQYGNASLSGVLTVDTLRANHIEGLEFIDSRVTNQNSRIALLESMLASSSAKAAVLGVTADGKIAGTSGTITPAPEKTAIEETPIASQSASDILAENLTKLLSASDSADATDFDIRTLSVDGLSVDSATVSADLRVRGNGIVEGIMNVIDTLTAGNLIVNGVTNFLGEVIFKEAVMFEKTPTFTQDTAGYIKVQKGAQTVSVTFSQEYAEEPVITTTLVTTRLSDEDYDKLVKADYCSKDVGRDACQEKIDLKLLSEQPKYIVTNRSTKGFTILLPDEAEIDYMFSWTAISVKKVAKEEAGSAH